MKIAHDKLKRLTTSIFAAAGCNPQEAARIGHYLTEANLVGHDSHGVIRVISYIDFLRAGKVVPNQTLNVLFENDVIAVVDGGYGFGQTIGEEATKLGIAKCAKHGVSVVGLRNAGHLGRIGDWPLLAARAGKVSLHFVNTSGAGILVAPLRRHRPAAVGQSRGGRRARGRRPADHHGHVVLHDRRGQGARGLQQGRASPRRLPHRLPRRADNRSQ